MATSEVKFGPAPSPEIFRDKWLLHFDRLARRLKVNYRDGKCELQGSEEHRDMFSIYQDGMDHILIFEAEAHQPELDEKDFQPETTIAKKRYIVSHLYVNPFTFVEDLKSRIEISVVSMQKKELGQWNGPPSWQMLPLRTRQVVNETIARREEALRDGKWILSEECEGIVGVCLMAMEVLADEGAGREVKRDVVGALMEEWDKR